MFRVAYWLTSRETDQGCFLYLQYWSLWGITFSKWLFHFIFLLNVWMNGSFKWLTNTRPHQVRLGAKSLRMPHPVNISESKSHRKSKVMCPKGVVISLNSQSAVFLSLTLSLRHPESPSTGKRPAVLFSQSYQIGSFGNSFLTGVSQKPPELINLLSSSPNR